MKTKLDTLLSDLHANGWSPGLTESSYLSIVATGIRSKNLALASVVAEIACRQHPLTLRGLFYQVVSAGWLPSTDQKHYNRIGRLLSKLRECRIVPFSWIVDNLRSTVKPSSWSGLNSFVDTVKDAYRKDFWESLPDYVHLFCEKDAVSGTISPVTEEYDVPLSPIRGYVSISYAHQIAEIWRRIEKPIFAYYVGDFDPSGFDLERDLKDKLSRYSNSQFNWIRLGLNAEDFEQFDLISLKPKQTDKRYSTFVDKHGSRCAELDAIPANDLRSRIKQAIETHVPSEQWRRLLKVEEAEKESFQRALEAIGANETVA